MGCTSSKKRTTSVDDLTAADKKEPVVSSKKNGQLASNDAKHKGDKGDANAIQIPGAHTSFMAPDGIPFIDEDVDEDMEIRGTAVVGNATTAKPDVNRNVVQAEVKSSPPIVVVEPSSETETIKTEEEKNREIGAEIMKREIEMTQTTSTVSPTTTTSETVHVEQVVITTTSESHTVVNGLQPASEEEQQRAAVKIQAGIRGYRDRQRVKALRASQQWQQPLHEDTSTAPVTNGEPAVDGPAADSTYHDDMQVIAECDDSFSVEHTPEMDQAAVKIQASYKGYKTRKELGKM